jgi:hypothetical protein
MTIFFLVFIIRNGIPGNLKGVDTELKYFYLSCFPALAGYILAWFKPYAGGIILIIGSLLLGSYFVYFSDFSMAMVFGIPALLIGLSFIASVHKELV